MQMIEAKIEGRKVVETPEAHVAPVIDIMEALKKSLAQKKPARAAASAAGAEEEAEQPAPAARKRSRRSRAG
jgi:non-homologous end joining protein Ku